MRKQIALFGLILIAFLAFSCALPQKKKVHLYHGEQPPPRFIRVVKASPQKVTFEIRIKFTQRHLYHIIADEEDNFIAEGWFPTAKDPRGIYRVTLKPKKGLTFQPGKTYYLCIGAQNPEQILYYSSNYRCLVYFGFTIPGNN
jgi:hypothetical protein